MDLRDYMYYRTRWGLSGSADYRVSNAIEPRRARPVLDVPKLGPEVGLHAERRRRAGGEHRLAPARLRRRQSGRRAAATRVGQNWLSWDVSGARSRMLQSGGNGGAKFKWNGADTNCADDPARPTDVYQPMFSASCFAAGADQHRGHRELQAVELEPGVGRRVGAAEPAGRGGARTPLSRRRAVRHARVRRQDPERPQVQRLLHDDLHRRRRA